mmetsp:Transcript_901/g.899  ORF Transcript_901/g.899 Transcript_901/m.899 type:complete len:173 (-) Transcript_901:180-698(-)
MPPPQLPKITTNGHKTLNASEAKALQELLKSEKERRKYFEENKFTMVRSRNPLTGEATPRDGQGEPIINTNWVDREPVLLRRKKDKELTEKIGVKSERYNCLGNLSNQNYQKNSDNNVNINNNSNNLNNNIFGYSSNLPTPSSRIGLDSKQTSGRIQLNRQQQLVTIGSIGA